MRPIYFVKYYDKGSTVMAADQIAAAFEARGIAARSIYARDLGDLHDAILVFIKTSRLDHLLGAKRRGNRLVLDVQDTVVFKRRIKNRWLFDALIFKNRRQLADFGRAQKPDRIVHHQWDERYQLHRAGESELKIGYFGLARSFAQWGELPEVACYDDDYFVRALDYNCHLSIREPGREFLYKPNCKVSTAAACGANLITTPDVSTVELLGDDYPYTCGQDRASILAAIDKARTTIGGPEWRRGLERMREVREITSLPRVLDAYLELFRDLA